MEQELYDSVSELQDRHWWFIARRNFVKAILSGRADPKDKSILDIGCGSGSMIDFLKNYGESVTGIDYSDYVLKLCSLRGHKMLVRGTVEKLPFSNESFDFVTSFEVLYHREVGDDTKVIKELYRVCKKGAMILIIDSAFNFLKGKHDDFAHGARRYTTGELAAKLSSAGFVVKRAGYLYMCIFPLLCIVRFFKNVFLPKDKTSSELHETSQWLNRCMISILKIESIISRKFNLPFGVSVFCLAEKV